MPNSKRLMLAATLVAALTLSGCQLFNPGPPAPDKIRIGYAVSITGPYASSAATVTTPNYRLWVHDVNARGGLWLSRYGKRVPIELIEYDDQSNVETAISLDEKLVIEDKVCDNCGPPARSATKSRLSR